MYDVLPRKETVKNRTVKDRGRISSLQQAPLSYFQLAVEPHHHSHGSMEQCMPRRPAHPQVISFFIAR